MGTRIKIAVPLIALALVMTGCSGMPAAAPTPTPTRVIPPVPTPAVPTRTPTATPTVAAPTPTPATPQEQDLETYLDETIDAYDEYVSSVQALNHILGMLVVPSTQPHNFDSDVQRTLKTGRAAISELQRLSRTHPAAAAKLARLTGQMAADGRRYVDAVEDAYNAPFDDRKVDDALELKPTARLCPGMQEFHRLAESLGYEMGKMEKCS